MNSDGFEMHLRDGRDHIDKGEWGLAAATLRDALKQSPLHSSADAALYWLSFCYKKQKQFKDANATLASLLQRFPASTWVGDALVMKAEIAPWVGGNPSGGNWSIAKDEQIISLADLLGTPDGASLGRADEVRIAAFQSLQIADMQRAVETTAGLLKAGTTASDILKQGIVRLWSARRLSSLSLRSGVQKNEAGGELVSLLRGILLTAFRTETNPKIRTEIIYTLASFADAETASDLSTLYGSERDQATKRTIIEALGSSANAVYPFGKVKGKNADPYIPKELARTAKIDFLIQLVRAEKDVELRRLAFSNLQHFQSWSESEPGAALMSQLYDAETDDALRVEIIRALAKSEQEKAARKLLAIAKSDRSEKLKLEAIYGLRKSKNPEVLKFLEDLIR
jgi:hypothetical protein